jgi:hypothetical protein
MKGGGGEEVQKWWKGAAPPCVDRSSTCCRPVGRWAEADPKGEKERGKGEGNLGILGLMYSL